eukprot:1128858-Rhodomonas_salina.2
MFWLFFPSFFLSCLGRIFDAARTRESQHGGDCTRAHVGVATRGGLNVGVATRGGRNRLGERLLKLSASHALTTLLQRVSELMSTCLYMEVT